MGIDIMEKRLLSALFLTHRNLAVSKMKVKDKATVDAHGYATILVSVFCRYGLSISAWASALLVLLYRAMRRPQCVKRAIVQKFHAFFVPAIHKYNDMLY